MALPPKEDPRRPLFLAARSARLLGLLIVILGIIVAVGAAMALGVGGGRGAGGAQTFEKALLVGITILYLGAGFAYRILADKLEAGKVWAIYTTMVLAGLSVLTGGVGLIRSLLAANNPHAPAGWVILIQLLVVLAFSQMLLQLRQGLKNLQSTPAFGAGFAPIMPAQPIAPPESEQQR